jgi:predicted transcriptional regulator of viral defense system
MKKLSDAQRILVKFVVENQAMTTQEAISQLCHRYYSNAEFQVAEVLTRLVKAGILERKARGVYVLPTVKETGKEGKLCFELYPSSLNHAP